MNTGHTPPVSARGLLRRRWPRFGTTGRLCARNVTLDLAMAVRDVSLGGFAAEAPVRFARGEQHEFHLSVEGEPPLRVRARAAWCQAKGDRDHHFITGWEALGDPETAAAMSGLVERHLAQMRAEPAADDAPAPHPSPTSPAARDSGQRFTGRT